MARWYRAFDSDIQSCFDLPGAMPCAPAALKDVIRIFPATLPELSVDASRGAHFSRSGASLIFSTDRARFLVRQNCIMVDAPTMADAAVSGHLAATVLPVLFGLRPNNIVLHAAGLMWAGTAGAIAVCGDSGAGKSTVVEHALAGGAQLVADDSLRVVVQPDEIRVSGLPAGYFRAAGDPTQERSFVPVDPPARVESAPLAMILILITPRSPTGPARFVEISGVAKIGALIRHFHRPRALAVMERQRDLGGALALLAGIRVVEWWRPDDSPDMTLAEVNFLAEANT